MNPSRLFKLLIVVITLAGGRAVADPLPQGHVRLSTGEGELIAPNGKHYTLPLGTHVLDDATWEKLDVEIRLLQDSKTRLEAENKSLKSSAHPDGPGWGTALVVLGSVVAISAGTYYFKTH